MVELPERLHAALDRLDGVVPLDALVLGGGTVLAARWHHRVSTDLDLFTDERSFAAQLYRQAHLIWPRAAEFFDVADLGRDHFGARTDGVDISISTVWCSALLDVGEHSGEIIAGFPLEASEAILVRKLQGRMFGFGTFTERDVYDLEPAHRDIAADLRGAAVAIVSRLATALGDDDEAP